MRIDHHVADQLSPLGEALAAEIGHRNRVGARSRSARWSATTRLRSSGMRRLNERRPASTWASHGRRPSQVAIFEAATAAASVEFVSPYTRTPSG